MDRIRKFDLSHLSLPAAAVTCCILLSTSLHAQRYLGSIQGDVMENTRAKIPGSTITTDVQVRSQLLDTGSPNIATTLSHNEVTDLPNVGCNPYVLATLAAGVVNTGLGGYFQGKSSRFTNRPDFGGPSTSLGNVAYSTVTLTLANDARVGHLTARIEFFKPKSDQH